MTIKRLEELKDKFAQGTGDMSDLGEIITDLFKTFSDRLKDINGQIVDIKENQVILYEEVSSMKDYLNPIYTIISDKDVED
jgi:hypothetical protein